MPVLKRKCSISLFQVPTEEGNIFLSLGQWHVAVGREGCPDSSVKGALGNGPMWNRGTVVGS